MEWEVGKVVTLKTTVSDEEIQGSVFGYDKQADLLLLKEQGAHNGVATLRFLKTACIKEVVAVANPAEPFDTSLPAVDLDKCYAREKKALQLAEADASRVGVGVTKEAQAIFDALFKTMPCRWRDRTIVILDEVELLEPYTVEMVRVEDAKRSALTMERVKKVLQAERQRLGLST